MRLLLFTGKGGVGKTTAAAGTATLGAQRGLQTLVLSTDAAHSLGDSYGVQVGGVPTLVDTNLYVQHVDAQSRFERSWGEIQGYLTSVLETVGVDPIEAEELTVLPGAEEVLALLEVRDQARSGRWDLIVVDCAPTAETLRLLALPEALGWYMDRVLPVERRVVKTLKPVLTRATGVPMPQDSVFDAVTRLHADLADVRAVLTSEDASVRMVLTPEAVVVAEARRSLTSLSLYGYRVDGVIANRIFPSAGGDAWRRQWVAAQATILADVEASFAPLDTWRSAYWPCEPVGLAELAAFATAAYGDSDPFQRPQGPEPVLMRRVGPGAADEEEYGASGGPADRASDAGADGRRGWGGSAPMAGADVLLRVHLPFAERGDVDLARHGDELVVTVGSYRRLLALPAALRRSDVVHAQLDDGALQVRFSPRGRP